MEEDMNLSKLPSSAFVDPSGINSTIVEELAQRVLNLILCHLQHARDRAPLPEGAQLPQLLGIPESPISEDMLLAQLESILAYSMNPAHPAFIGHMDSMPTTMSFLGEMISVAINNNMLSFEMSPSLSLLESYLTKELAALFGLGSQSGGVILSGGTLANLQALAVARNVKLNALKQGVAGLQSVPILFTSDVAHTSIQKAAMLLGLGTSAVIPIRTNINSQMEIGEL
ncbi:hypothetical protein GQ464_009455 [Rhodocaloribacter litoris]|uniref:pyridoxal phosphate-dependent decarboxylase family protein n=1 Tax=Rhodocaloribacter litoris TaxID=2558931 RepID=UPI001E51E53A|nr:pyridoxal-dependent decarboxylase [Rhodocaloribacter litoris]QXD13706.1 hypothetical protein GQ464_009455 [Rhodocaloribacter litoris]